MQQKSAAWWSALTASAAEWRYGLDLLASDEQTLLEDPTIFDENASDRLVPQSARVTLDVTAATHRTFQLSLRNTDGRYLPGIAGYATGGAGTPTATGLTWYNVRYRPWVDLRTGFSASGVKQWDRSYLGIYVLTQPEAQVKPVGSLIQLSLLDKSSLLRKPNLITASNLPTYTLNGVSVGGYASGAAFDTVMTDLATKAGIPANRIAFEPSSLTLPAAYSISEGDEWWTHLQALAGSMAHVLYFDSSGVLVRRANPLLVNAAPSYTIASGPQSTITQINRKQNLNDTYNHVIVIGGSSKVAATYRGEAQVTNLSSPYHKNEIGERVVYVGAGGKLGDKTPDPTIGSIAQATTRAQVVLAQHLGQNETVQITGRNNPALEGYDRLTVRSPEAGLNMDFMAQQITWNLAHSGMTINSTRWVSAG